MGAVVPSSVVVFVAAAWTVSIVFSYSFGHYCGRHKYRKSFPCIFQKQKYIIKRMFSMPYYDKEFEGYYISKYVYTSEPDLARKLTAGAARRAVRRISRYKAIEYGTAVAESVEVIPVFEETKACTKT